MWAERSGTSLAGLWHKHIRPCPVRWEARSVGMLKALMYALSMVWNQMLLKFVMLFEVRAWLRLGLRASNSSSKASWYFLRAALKSGSVGAGTGGLCDGAVAGGGAVGVIPSVFWALSCLHLASWSLWMKWEWREGGPLERVVTGSLPRAVMVRARRE